MTDSLVETSRRMLEVKDAAGMIIYRVEHRDDRTGPYGFDFYDGKLDDRMCVRHPEFNHPSGEPWPPTYRYGFSSKNELLRWWADPEERATLSEHDFVITRYSVPAEAVAQGLNQLVFDATRAWRLGCERLPQ
jgi:hypothetical protein